MRDRTHDREGYPSAATTFDAKCASTSSVAYTMREREKERIRHSHRRNIRCKSGICFFCRIHHGTRANSLVCSRAYSSFLHLICNAYHMQNKRISYATYMGKTREHIYAYHMCISLQRPLPPLPLLPSPPPPEYTFLLLLLLLNNLSSSSSSS